jgi:ADP-heptose:LPS heptosyltransferase
MPSVLRIRSWGNIGDAVLLTPCLRALKNEHRDLRLIVYYRTDGHRDVFLHNPFVDELVDWADGGRLLPSNAKVFEPATHWASSLYEVGISSVLAEMLSITLGDARPALFLSDEERTLAEQDLTGLPRPIVAIHPSSTFANKEWFPERWAQLIRRSPSGTFVQLGLPLDSAIEGAVDFRGKSLRETFAVISQCEALLGVDSGFAHVATALGTPAIVLFGPASPTVYGHAANVNLCAGVECSPCLDLLHYGKCPLNRVCMRAISVDSVQQALTDLLRRTEEQRQLRGAIRSLDADTQTRI